MGCDIHLYVERRKKGKGYNFSSVAFRGEFSERDYVMFALLADVRNYEGFRSLPIRGLPDDIGFDVFNAMFKRAVPEYKDKLDDEYYYLQEKADGWVKSGISFVREQNGVKWYSDPDAHSCNWCTPDEMVECVNKAFKNKDGEYEFGYIEWLGLAGYMKALEDNGNYEVRAVYWFDN